jgi:hypothetical protein
MREKQAHVFSPGTEYIVQSMGLGSRDFSSIYIQRISLNDIHIS